MVAPPATPTLGVALAGAREQVVASRSATCLGRTLVARRGNFNGSVDNRGISSASATSGQRRLDTVVFAVNGGEDHTGTFTEGASFVIAVNEDEYGTGTSTQCIDFVAFCL